MGEDAVTDLLRRVAELEKKVAALLHHAPHQVHNHYHYPPQPLVRAKPHPDLGDPQMGEMV